MSKELLGGQKSSHVDETSHKGRMNIIQGLHDEQTFLTVSLHAKALIRRIVLYWELKSDTLKQIVNKALIFQIGLF